MWYGTFLLLHSWLRWLVVISLLYTTGRAVQGWVSGRSFNKLDNSLRHNTATIAHLQLAIGYVLYFISPIVQYFRHHFKEAMQQPELVFFGLIHIILMTIAVVFITLGSSLAKRKESDRDKFQTIAIWFVLAIVLIFIAIPWPFSPLANRAYLRFT